MEKEVIGTTEDCGERSKGLEEREDNGEEGGTGRVQRWELETKPGKT